MSSIILRRLLLLALPLSNSVFAQPPPSPSERPSADAAESFQDLLNALPEESLHAALHEHLHPKYQDGVYEHDRSAVERVHIDDPSLASRLVDAAKLSASNKFELVKRQNATNPPASSPQVNSPTSSSTPPAVVIPVEVPSTDSAGGVTIQTTSAIASPTASIEVPVTITNDAGAPVVTTSAAPAVILSSTNAAGNVVLTTSAVPLYTPPPPGDVTLVDSSGASVVVSNVRPGQVLTATNAQGRTLVTTYTPAKGAVSSLVLATTTLADGRRSTITSFAVASGADTPIGDAGAKPSKNPSLQKGAANDIRSRSMGKEAIALVAGAVGVAWFL